MKIKCYGKINLSLDITGKREDGYHLLEMIMQTIDLYDILNIEKKEYGISLSCNKSYVPTTEKNIAFKAAKLFLETFHIYEGVHIDIEKNIPVSAGMAGGSANAAGVLRGLNELFEVNASNKTLENLALKLGADVPYCINGGTVLCEGVGEILTPLKEFDNIPVVIIKPDFGVSTIETYRNFDLSKARIHADTYNLIRSMNNRELDKLEEHSKNLLENVTLGRHKVLWEIKNTLKELDASLSMMSGSGPTIYGIFEDFQTAQKAYDYFRGKFREVFITRTINP